MIPSSHAKIGQRSPVLRVGECSPRINGSRPPAREFGGSVPPLQPSYPHCPCFQRYKDDNSEGKQTCDESEAMSLSQAS
jgi:hypothetical protein